MLLPFNELLLGSLLVTLVLVLRNHRQDRATMAAAAAPAATPASFTKFRNKYLGVYLLMVAGDWLQGPYVYSLYSSYGYSRSDIALLFVVGFAASMIVGTFVGSLADSMGRRKFCCLYALLYIASCFTKHFSNFSILLLGRLLGGVATSLLFSVFEAWLVCECNARQYGADRLGRIFALQTLLNGFVAIASGILGQIASDYFPLYRLSGSGSAFVGGYTVPFDLAIAVLFAGLVVCLASWEENYGERQQQRDSLVAGLGQGWQVLRTNRTVLYCGLVQSLFEGAMYSFVFEWSPALTSSDDDSPPPPYGTIFATFMVCCMAGSQLVKPLLSSGRRPQDVLPWVFLFSALGLGVVPLLGTPAWNMYGFLLFEIMVGLYYPLMGMLKSQIVPELHRSTLYNLFRIPLNAIVLFILLNHFTVSQTFQICVVLLLACAAMQMLMMREMDRANKLIV